ncbi:MAG: SpoIIE family protein phosphatase [Planctomycetota bacterium]|nr:SpoIIE family protein phosphatase [Planctomycetota bacterium]
MAEASPGYVEIQEPAGSKRRVPLAGPKMVIGRGAEAELRLDSAAVSRQHAEIYVDPFGRWWVRDLKSRNGTLVNGQAVAEHVIAPTDVIQVDEFIITVSVTGEPASRPKTKIGTSLTIGDSKAGSIQSLKDMEPPRISRGHLVGLTAFATKLLATEDDAERLKLLCRLMLAKEFHGTSAVAIRVVNDLPPGAQPEMLCEPESARNWRAGETPYVSRTLLRAVRESRSPAVATNMGSGGAGVVEMSLAGDVAQVSAIACPFRLGDDSMDVLYVSFPAEYGTGEWLSLGALAAEQFQQAQTAWDARRAAQAQALVEQELEQAHAIQMRFIPTKVEVPGLDVAMGFQPCRWVGGDYIDVMPTADGRVFIVIADVCGKGLQAALITATLHSMLHTNVATGAKLVDVISRLNEYLCATLPHESFVTMIGMSLDLKTGALECINGGHPPAMIVDPKGNLRLLQAGENLPMGYMPSELVVQADKLEAGHVLALYTDGLTEMNNEAGDMMGEGALGEYVRSACAEVPNAPIADMSVRLKTSLDQYLGNALPNDDRTYLLLRRAPGA